MITHFAKACPSLLMNLHVFDFSLGFILSYLLRGATVLVEHWLPHVLYVRFHDNEFLQGGVISPMANPQPGGPRYLS
jgi:hypothetical protein